MKIRLLLTIVLLVFINAAIKSQWLLLDSIASGEISDIAVKDNFQFAATETSGVFRSSDNGLTWVSANSGISNTFMNSFAINSSGIFVSTGDGVFFSSDNGNNWSSASSGLSGGWIRKIVSRNDFVYAGHVLAGVYKTTNNGNNWSRFALGEGDKLFTLYCTQSEFYISIANTILRTTNDGQTFDYVGNGITNLWVMTLSSFENDLYAGTRDGIFHSTNIGTFWTRVSNGLTDSVFNVIINKGVNVFAGSVSKGIFLSTDKGQSWSPINSGLTDTNISSLATTSEYLFAGTADGKIWRRPLSEIPLGIFEYNNYVVSDFKLFGNFPNPFNPSTKIQFTVNRNISRIAELKIYNSAGRLIEFQKLNINSPGNYETEWNATGFPSGVYFYSIKLGNEIQTSKMALMK